MSSVCKKRQFPADQGGYVRELTIVVLLAYVVAVLPAGVAPVKRPRCRRRQSFAFAFAFAFA
jgi:hypothetical protein